MLRVYLVRHGQTSWNERGVYRGRADVPLSAAGRRQARAAARALAGCGAGRVVCSPLSRARDTAEAIARLTGARVAVDERLVEVDRGAWVGLTPAQARRRFPRAYRAWLARPSRCRFPNGESVAAVARRARRAFAAAARGARAPVVVVSHNVTLRAMLCALLGLPLDAAAALVVSEASITELAFSEGRWRLVRLNDRGHLPAAPLRLAAD